MKKNDWCGLPVGVNFKQVLKMMKLTAFFLIFCVVQVLAGSAYSQGTQLTLNLKNSTVEDVLLKIEQQSNFVFLYNKDIVNVDQLTNIKVENASIEDVLNKLFADTNVKYHIMDRQIVLSPEYTQQQPKAITGKVTDNNGLPLPGVTVVVKGTTNGTITGADGSYSLTNIPGDAILQFSFIGMKTQEIIVKNQTTIDISLQEENIRIDEVVAIGYGVQKKLTATGSVVSTKGEDIIKSQSPNVINSITGHLAGVIVNNRTGEPGRDDPSIYIRGRSTTGNSDPLIVIDGVERDGFGRLNPNDIESISVLKDASAAIYGARAANGVILVTTKQGKEEKPTFDFSYNQGFSQPTRNPKMADSYTFAKVYNEIEINEGRSSKYTEEELMKFKDGTDPNYPNTDWYDFITKTLTPQHRVNLSVSGGNKSLTYYLSLGELSQDGQFNYGSTQIKRYNLRSNVQVRVNEYLKIGLELAGRYDKNHYPYQDTRGIYSHIFLYQPDWTPYWPGTNYLRPNRDSENIINWVSDACGTDDEKFKGLESTLNFSLDIPKVKGLSISGSANYDTGHNFNKTFQLPTYVYYRDSNTGEYTKGRSGSGTDKANLAETFDEHSTLTVNGKINYDQRFGQHNLGIMLGYEEMHYQYDYLYAYRSDFTSTVLPELFAGNVDKNKQDNDGTSSKTTRRNYFGRVTYDYASKYMAQFIFRYDGSPNFPSNKRWGFFPGISLGWRISEEPFMSNMNFINNLKIRSSYGKMGNDQVQSFQYLTTYKYGNNYVVGDKDVSGLIQSGIPNKNITWEEAKTFNIGFESTLWSGVLGIEFDFFKTRRSNILTKRTVVIPDYTGLTLPDENVGKVDNKGFELQLSHNNDFHGVKCMFKGNISFARNKIIFADEQPAAEKYQKATGRPIGAELYYKAIGIFRDQEDINSYPHLTGARPGDIIYKDANDDDIINSRDMIRVNKTATPEIVYGFTASFNYKSFDLSVLFQGQANAQTYFGNYFPVMSYSLGNFTQWRANNHWSAENTDATMPRPSIENQNNNTESSTQWLVDAGFLRLKNMEIGYNLPKSICERLTLKNMRVYISGNNLLILYDHMKDIGFDPETTDYWYYPQQRTFNIGINLTF